MRFLTFEHNGTEAWGLIRNTGVIDLSKRYGQSLFDILRQGRLDEVKAAAANLPADVATEAIRYLPPIRTPEKIACVGVNYADRNAEYKDGSEMPRYPSLFMRAPDSLTGHNQPLIRPLESDKLDYEGEIVLIIGKAGRRIREEDAYQYIAGLTIMNEGTLRDWVRHAKFNVTQGKNFVHSGAIGPWMTTLDEFSPSLLETMRLTTHVNGDLRQDDTSASMMFSFKYIIHYLSKFYLLKPGDVIATGTPKGSGARFDPPRYLKPGDVVEVTVEGIGTLSNRVEAELAHST